MGIYRVKGFTRDHTKVKAHTRRTPQLSGVERARRAGQARRTLMPAGIKVAGQRGFTETTARLKKYQDHIKSPERLSGWLKGQAKKRGQLSRAHPYKGRKGYRKHRIGGRKVTAAQWRKHKRKK